MFECTPCVFSWHFLINSILFTGKSKKPAKKAKSKTSRKEDKARDGKHVSKSGKPLKGKKSVGKQPASLDNPPALAPERRPDDDPEYLASTDEYDDTEPAMPELYPQDGEESDYEIPWKKRKLTDKEDERIIQFVKDNPLFYDMNLTAFQHPELKKKKLRTLQNELKIPGEYDNL